MQALKQLSDNRSITIKPADKGWDTVLMNNNKYVTMCNNILKNKDWYCRITIEKYREIQQGLLQPC